MQLKKLKVSDLVVGKLVVLLQQHHVQNIYGLRLIESVDTIYVHLSPVSVMFDEDDVCERMAFEEAFRDLRIPELEINDPIIFHGRQGKVTKMSQNDYHVSVSIDEMPDKEIYTNLVHLDFTPSIRACIENTLCLAENSHG